MYTSHTIFFFVVIPTSFTLTFYPTYMFRYHVFSYLVWYTLTFSTKISIKFLSFWILPLHADHRRRVDV